MVGRARQTKKKEKKKIWRIIAHSIRRKKTKAEEEKRFRGGSKIEKINKTK